MNTLIAKYIKAFESEKGSPTEKVKKILMRYAHDWEWENSDSIVADLIDDTNITADDIVDFLADVYEHEGGNEEFHYAVRALQIALRKSHLAEAASHHGREEDVLDDHETSHDESDYLNIGSLDFLNNLHHKHH